MVFKILNGTSPEYLQNAATVDIANIENGSRMLRSSLDFFRIKVPRDNSYEYTMAEHWNSLPIYIRSESNVNTLKKALKTYYFSIVFNET